MIVPKNFRNTYEESPEKLKDLVKKGNEEKGQKPKTKVSRDQLLRSHEHHLRWLSEGSLPVRNLILPLPYTPSRISAHDERCHKVSLRDLRIDERDPNEVLLLRTLAFPYVYSSTITVVEDHNGDCARLTLCNLEDTVVDSTIPQESILAIKQPCWSRLVDEGYHIRVDHTSDFEVLDPNSTLVPELWKSTAEVDADKDANDWRKEGDMMFLKKKFRKSLSLYDRGLAHLSSNPDSQTEIDLYRKRCGVNIVLLRLDDAAGDLTKAIRIYAQTNPGVSSTELSDYSVIAKWLRNHSTEDPLQIASKISRPLKELAARIKFDLGLYQNTPEYNLQLISSYVGPMTLHVDAANYISATKVRQTDKHGRGLFAIRNLKAGELICAEKAFVLPGYFIQDRSSDCQLYSLGDETAAPRPGALLFKELVQKLRWNPSLRKEYFELDDGGYWKENGWELAEGEDIPVDIFRVEFIRRYNCFSVPTRSSDLLNKAPNSNPELRNGFWNHASYVNHSCLPNSVRTFIGDIHFLRATRNIKAGEEITHQYISPDIDIGDRQSKYQASWGFECDCELCVVDGSMSAEVRAQRGKKFSDLKEMVLKLSQRGKTITTIKKIARGVRELEALYTPIAEGEQDVYANLPRLALVHPTLFLTEAWRSFKNVEKTIEYATQLLRNFGVITLVEGERFEVVSNAGLINVESVRALKYLAEGYKLKGQAELTHQILSTARVWFVIITGAEVGAEEFLTM